MLPLELVTAYQNADYYVLKKVPFKFKIGVFSVDLKNLLKENRVKTGYLISAYNPRSQPTGQIKNIDYLITVSSKITPFFMRRSVRILWANGLTNMDL